MKFQKSKGCGTLLQKGIKLKVFPMSCGQKVPHQYELRCLGTRTKYPVKNLVKHGHEPRSTLANLPRKETKTITPALPSAWEHLSNALQSIVVVNKQVIQLRCGPSIHSIIQNLHLTELTRGTNKLISANLLRKGKPGKVVTGWPIYFEVGKCESKFKFTNLEVQMWRGCDQHPTSTPGPQQFWRWETTLPILC